MPALPAPSDTPADRRIARFVPVGASVVFAVEHSIEHQRARALASTDGGQTFRELDGVTGSALAAGGSERVWLIATTVGLFWSDDQGSTWERIVLPPVAREERFGLPQTVSGVALVGSTLLCCGGPAVWALTREEKWREVARLPAAARADGSQEVFGRIEVHQGRVFLGANPFCVYELDVESGTLTLRSPRGRVGPEMFGLMPFAFLPDGTLLFETGHGTLVISADGTQRYLDPEPRSALRRAVALLLRPLSPTRMLRATRAVSPVPWAAEAFLQARPGAIVERRQDGRRTVVATCPPGFDPLQLAAAASCIFIGGRRDEPGAPSGLLLEKDHRVREIRLPE